MAQQHQFNKSSAATRMFSKNYTAYITELVMAEYGPSYTSVQTHGKQWRNIIKWTPEIEEFLILKSKMFIRLLDSRDSASTDPRFLLALTRLMADYLAKFCMMSPDVPTRKKAFKNLHTQLYDNFGYIQHLLNIQAQKRAQRDSYAQQYASPRQFSAKPTAPTPQDIANRYNNARNQMAAMAGKSQNRTK